MISVHIFSERRAKDFLAFFMMYAVAHPRVEPEALLFYFSSVLFLSPVDVRGAPLFYAAAKIAVS
jgi:hypothetical protein